MILALSILSSSAVSGTEYPVRETIRDLGEQFEGVVKWFSEGCGPVSCSLTDEDNCQLTFDDYFASSADQPMSQCQIRLEVDLPEGWSMAPKAVTLEGDYQVSENGMAWVETTFGLKGGRKVTLNNYKTPLGEGHDALGSDAFLISKEVEGLQFSPCGGIAVFEGTIDLFATKGRFDKFETEVNITQQDGNGAKAQWGWVYKQCEMPVGSRIKSTVSPDHINPVKSKFLDGDQKDYYLIKIPNKGSYSLTSPHGKTSLTAPLFRKNNQDLGEELTQTFVTYSGNHLVAQLEKGEYYLELEAFATGGQYQFELNNHSGRRRFLPIKLKEIGDSNIYGSQYIEGAILKSGQGLEYSFQSGKFKNLRFSVDGNHKLFIYELSGNQLVPTTDFTELNQDYIYSKSGRLSNPRKTYVIRIEGKGSTKGKFKVTVGTSDRA